MLGTLLNTAPVIVGGTAGTFLRARFPERVRQTVILAIGLNLLDLTAIRVANFLPVLLIAPASSPWFSCCKHSTQKGKGARVYEGQA